MIIAIDGPVAAGKTTTAKYLAKKLNFEILDTGALYRAVAIGLFHANIKFDDDNAIAEYVTTHPVTFDEEGRIFIDNQNVTKQIRSTIADKYVTPTCQNATVRKVLTEQQRHIAQNGNYIAEGRDTTTTVFPEAELKIFLTADHRIRAIRRQSQFADKGILMNYEDVNRKTCRRDFADMTREISPLEVAPDAIIIDTTELSPDEVASLIIKHIPKTEPKELTLENIKNNLYACELEINSQKLPENIANPQLGLITEIKTILRLEDANTIIIEEKLVKITDMMVTPLGIPDYQTTIINADILFKGTFEQLLQSEYAYDVRLALR